MSAEYELARVESVRLLRDPALSVALAATAWWVMATHRSSAHQTTYLLLIGYSLMLPGFVMVVHTILSTLRSRIEHTDELMNVLPVGRDRRTVSHALSAAAGVMLGAATILATYVILRPAASIGSGDNSIPPTIDIPRPNLAQLLQGPIAILAVLAFVVALTRWVPTWLVILPLAVLLLVQGVFLGLWFAVPSGNATWWFPLGTGVVHGEWIGCGETDRVCDLPVSGFDQTTPWWHLAYLISVAVTFVVIAVLRHRRDRSTWFWFVVSLASVVTLAIVQLAVSVEYAPVSALP